MDSLVSSVSVPQSISYRAEKVLRFRPDSTISRINQVDPSSQAKISVLRVENNYLAVFANLNISATNELGEKISLKGDLRCKSFVGYRSNLERDLNENEALKSIDAREEVATARAKTAEKAAELAAEIERNSPKIIDSFKPEVISAYWKPKIDTAVEMTKDAGQDGLDKAADLSRQGQDLVLMKTVDGIEYLASIEPVREAHAKAVELAVEGMVLANPTRQAIVTGIVNSVEAVENGAKAAPTVISNAYNSAANSLADMRQAASIYWNSKLDNKATISLEIPDDKKQISGRIQQKPEHTRIMSCKVTEENGQKRLVINTNLFRYDTSIFATISFPVTQDLKTIADTSVKLDKLEIVNNAKKTNSTFTNPSLLTPELMSPILVSAETIEVDGKQVVSNNYAFYFDFNNDEGKKVILEGQVQCVISK
jgi:hypothetical protein